MKISTFDDDLLELKDFAERLEHFINIEQQYVEGGLVVGLSSSFGTGKSTFFQMWMSEIQERQSNESPLAILLNAWESDYYGDPLFAIISALVDKIKKGGKSAAKIIDAAKDIGWFSTAIGGQVVKKFTGIDAIEAGDLAEKKRKGRDEKILEYSDTFSIYEGRKNAMHSLREALIEFIDSENQKIIFLVDELDRCRPDYAISYLETIKHIFDIRGTVFLLAADRKHLENSAKTAFGAELDFNEYYRKFIHRETTLPEISENSYKRIASKYVGFYLQKEEGRNCFMELDRARLDEIVELVGSLKLTPRQIQEVFRILGHIFETSEEKRGKLLWCIGIGSILMAVLKISNSDIYHLLGSQQLDPQVAIDFFKDKLKVSEVYWWFTLCLTGGGLKIKEDENVEDIMKKVGLLTEENEFNPQRDFGQWYNGWGRHASNRFNQIFEKIEQLGQWK